MKAKSVLALIFVLWAGLALAAQPERTPKAHKTSGMARDAAAKAPDTAPKAGQQSKKKTVVTGVQVYSGRDYSRIVLVLSGEAQRRWQLLPPDPKDQGVRRLYVDLDDTVIKPGVPNRFDVRGDVARKVRLSYFKPGVARLVVEVENLKNQQVFELENPNRVIVDVQGEATKKPVGVQSQTVKEQAGTGQAPAEKEKPSGRGQSGQSGQPGKLAGDDRPGSPGVNLASPNRKKMAKQLVEQLGLTVRTVIVDAGHGGKDPGATGVGGLHEKTVTLRVAKLLGERLSKMGFEVSYTRTTDKFVPLEMRTAMANARKADLFVSIHCNANPDSRANGLETYSLNLASTPDEVRVAARENSEDPKHISDMQKILDDLMHASKLSESKEFAKSAHQAALCQARKCQNLRDRGLHEAPFYVLLGARMPAILVELGYVTNPVEAVKLQDEKYLEAMAKGIAEGIKAYKERIERYAAKN